MTSPTEPEQPPPPGYAPPQGYGPPGYAAAPSTESKAIIALVLAIASFLPILPVIPAIIALFLASSAKRDIEASGGRLTGLGLVTASKIVSWINIGLFLLVIVVVLGAVVAISPAEFS